MYIKIQYNSVSNNIYNCKDKINIKISLFLYKIFKLASNKIQQNKNGKNI